MSRLVGEMMAGKAKPGRLLRVGATLYRRVASFDGGGVAHAHPSTIQMGGDGPSVTDGAAAQHSTASQQRAASIMRLLPGSEVALASMAEEAWQLGGRRPSSGSGVGPHLCGGRGAVPTSIPGQVGADGDIESGRAGPAAAPPASGTGSAPRGAPGPGLSPPPGATATATATVALTASSSTSSLAPRAAAAAPAAGRADGGALAVALGSAGTGEDGLRQAPIPGAVDGEWTPELPILLCWGSWLYWSWRWEAGKSVREWQGETAHQNC